MERKIQLMIFVSFTFLVLVVCWFFVSFRQRSFDFSLGSPISDLKIDLKNNFDNFYPNGFDVKSQLKNALNKRVFEDQKVENIKKDLVGGVLSEISSSTPSFVFYNHEPWKVSFEYNSKLDKKWNSDIQEINLSSGVKDSFISIKKQALKEKTFNTWLSKNYDLQKLDKKTNNNLVFWGRDISNKNQKIKEDYLNIGKDLYIFRVQDSINSTSTIVSDFDNILNSFKKYGTE